MTFLLVVCFFGLVIGILVIKDGTGKEKGIGALIMLGCTIGIIAILHAAYVPYNPKSYEKKIEQQREDQWIQDNFGNGKGEEIFNAIDNYKK